MASSGHLAVLASHGTLGTPEIGQRSRGQPGTCPLAEDQSQQALGQAPLIGSPAQPHVSAGRRPALELASHECLNYITRIIVDSSGYLASI